jgi:hypothetical protein
VGPLSFASVLVPILVDWIKSAAPAVTRKVFGESVDDQIKLEASGIERLKALAVLDNPYGTPSQWVVDLRGAFRYISAGALILGGLGLAGYGASTLDPILVAAGLDLAASPFGFIFGERLVLTFKGGGK